MAKKKNNKEELEVINENIVTEIENDTVNEEEVVREEEVVTEDEVKDVIVQKVEDVKEKISEEPKVVTFTTVKAPPKRGEKKMSTLNFGYAWNGQNFD